MRLFVALDLPAAVKDRLSALQAEIPLARWVTREQMHLTLFFIGETEQKDLIRQSLDGIRGTAFTLTINGVGRFPQQQRQPPRVLWAGLDDEPALKRLHQQVTNALTPLGFVPDDRPFSPHITLARLKAEKPLPAVDAFIEAHQSFQVDEILIDAMVLFSSTLTPQGPRYQRQAVYTLDPA